MDRRPFSIVLLLLAGPALALAQEPEMPTPEQFAERAAAAAAAPLFLSKEPLKITLRTDIDFLRRERNDTLEVDGTVTFIDMDGSEVTRPVQVRVRGNFRASRRNCNFPPLRLDFPREEMEGTVFEGQNRLKLVTPCQDDRDDYQRYIFDEYLAYGVLNLLTPVSHRARLFEITYEDVNGRYETRTKMAFVLESDEAVAERNRAIVRDLPVLDPRAADQPQAIIAGMFNYMIGNTDWSAVYFHNIIVMQTEDGRYLTVPYDFDHSGLVNARYATVDPSLHGRITRVRQRLYRDYCRPTLDQSTATALFSPHRDAIAELYRAFPHYQEPDQAENALEYYEDFWETIDNPRRFQRNITEDCLTIPY